MAKRLYGNVTAMVEPVSVTDSQDDVKESDIITKMSPALGGNPVKPLSVVIAILGIIFVVLTVVYLYVIKFDKGQGSNSADAAATSFVQSLTADDKDFATYVPRKIRSNGAFVDDGYMSMLKQLDEVYDVDVSELSVLKSENASPDRLTTYENTISNLYKVDLDIKLAKSISVRVVYRSNIDSNERAFDIDVVTIKDGFRWYVVPGLTEYTELVRTDKIVAQVSDTSVDNITEDVDTVDTPVDMAEGFDDSGSDTVVDDASSELVSMAKTDGDDVVVVEPQEEIVKQVEDLNFYKKALTDLQKGQFKVDDKDYVLPGKIEDFKDLFVINYGHNGLEENTEILSNYLVENIPVSFVDEDYKHTDLLVYLGNDTADTIVAKDSIITCIGFVYPQSAYDYQVYDYPLIYLPGNVTFGTSYDDVVKMYGDLAPAEDTSCLHLYSDNAKVYQIELNNSHNFLYLQFDDDKLVGVQWYYFDFNEY